MAGSLTGKLLVASPLLEDPNFYRAVVLVCMHDDDGALGVILNRPLEVAVRETLPGWDGPLSLPEVVYEGGPVERSAALGIGRVPDGLDDEGLRPVAAGLALVNLDREDWGGITEVRVYSGYAGWTSGQLEGEIEGEAWFVVDPAPSDPFTPQPDRLWRHVLRRQRGDLRMFAFYPDDPRLN